MKMKMKNILVGSLLVANTIGLGWTVNKVSEMAVKVDNIKPIESPTNIKQEVKEVVVETKEEKKEVVEVAQAVETKEQPVKEVEPKKEVEKTTTNVEVIEVKKEEPKEEEVVEEVVEEKQIIELEDGSTVLINSAQGLYNFYPTNMGDWYYSFDNEQQLQWAIETHLDIYPSIEKIEKIEIVKTEVHEDGDVVLELTDGSAVLYNETTNEYYFYASNMGDWEMQVRNAQELKNVISTYLELTYGI